MDFPMTNCSKVYRGFSGVDIRDCCCTGGLPHQQSCSLQRGPDWDTPSNRVRSHSSPRPSFTSNFSPREAASSRYPRQILQRGVAAGVHQLQAEGQQRNPAALCAAHRPQQQVPQSSEKRNSLPVTNTRSSQPLTPACSMTRVWWTPNVVTLETRCNNMHMDNMRVSFTRKSVTFGNAHFSTFFLFVLQTVKNTKCRAFVSTAQAKRAFELPPTPSRPLCRQPCPATRASSS